MGRVNIKARSAKAARRKATTKRMTVTKVNKIKGKKNTFQIFRRKKKKAKR